MISSHGFTKSRPLQASLHAPRDSYITVYTISSLTGALQDEDFPGLRAHYAVFGVFSV